MKQVIYKDFGKYKATNEKNYNSMIQNEREIVDCEGFASAKQIKDYFMKYFKMNDEDIILKCE